MNPSPQGKAAQVQITCILSNFNHGQTLSTAVEAMAGQGATLGQLLVIDDGSTDDSKTVLERLKKKIPLLEVHYNPENQGVIRSIKHGLALTRHPYVYTGAADDMILPGFLESAAEILARHPEAGICCGRPIWWTVADDRQVQLGMGMPDVPIHVPPKKCADLVRQERLVLAGHTCVFNRDLLLGVGDFHADLKWHTDWFAMYVLAFRYGVCWAPEARSIMRSLPSTYSASGVQRRKEQAEVCRNIVSLLLLPEYEDVRGAFIESAILHIFSTPMFFVLLRDPRRWRFITGLYLTRLAAPFLRRYELGRRFLEKMNESADFSAVTHFDLSAMRVG